MTLARAAAAVALAVATSGCSRPLPEAGSEDARLYEARCGTCHRVYAPHTLTPTMWRVQVDRMDQKFRAAGAAPPSGAERERLVAYLVRNAGG